MTFLRRVAMFYDFETGESLEPDAEWQQPARAYKKHPSLVFWCCICGGTVAKVESHLEGSRQEFSAVMSLCEHPNCIREHARRPYAALLPGGILHPWLDPDYLSSAPESLILRELQLFWHHNPPEGPIECSSTSQANTTNQSTFAPTESSPFASALIHPMEAPLPTPLKSGWMTTPTMPGS